MVECTSYEKMVLDNKFTDRNPGCRAAGKSISVIGDGAYPPIPTTPNSMRKYRLNTIPGEIITHWGLKDQRLPDDEFRYGICSDTGESVEEIFNKAAEATKGMAEYKNDRKEDIYISKKREPLGVSFKRGHELPDKIHAVDFKGFGVAVEHPTDMAKNALYPRNVEPDSNDVQQQYRWTHGNYAPGEMIRRDYKWPEETKKDTFRFGLTDREETGVREGDLIKAALDTDHEDDGTYTRTMIVDKRGDDFRNRDYDHIGKPHYMVYEYPPVATGHAFGKASGERVCTTEMCMRVKNNQLQPDADVGKCIKEGRRNFTDNPRVFGVPSIRSDIPVPSPEKRSLADNQNYGDEHGCGPLLNPDKYENMNVSQDIFLLRREKKELRGILKSAGYEYDDETYDVLWDKARALFEDELDLVSVDSVLHITRGRIADDVASQFSPFSAAEIQE